jgi:hypothetical protein
MNPKIITIAVALIVAGTIVFFVSQKKEDTQTVNDDKIVTPQTPEKTISPQDVSVKDGKFTGTKEQLEDRAEAIAKGPYAVKVSDFYSKNQGLKQKADELFNQQDFINKTNKTLLDHKETSRDEILAALEVVSIRLDPEHESGLRKIIKEGIPAAKIAAMTHLVRLVRGQAIDALSEQEKSENKEVKATATALLLKLDIGEKALPKLLANLSDKSGRTRNTAWVNLEKTLKQLKKAKTWQKIKKSGYDPRRSPARQVKILENISKISALIK